MKKSTLTKVAIAMIVSFGLSQSLIASGDIELAQGKHKKILTNSMLAVLPSLPKINKKIIALVQDLTYGKSPAVVITELVDFYKNTQEPLLKAITELVRQKKYLKASIEIALLLRNSIPDSMPRASEIEQWILDLSEILTCVESILEFMKNNPKMVAMIIK